MKLCPSSFPAAVSELEHPAASEKMHKINKRNRELFTYSISPPPLLGSQHKLLIDRYDETRDLLN